MTRNPNPPDWMLTTCQIHLFLSPSLSLVLSPSLIHSLLPSLSQSPTLKHTLSFSTPPSHSSSLSLSFSNPAHTPPHSLSPSFSFVVTASPVLIPRDFVMMKIEKKKYFPSFLHALSQYKSIHLLTVNQPAPFRQLKSLL